MKKHLVKILIFSKVNSKGWENNVFITTYQSTTVSWEVAKLLYDECSSLSLQSQQSCCRIITLYDE